MVLEFREFRLDIDEERLWQGDRAIELRPKTFAVLKYLAERPGKLVRNEELLDAVWEGSAVTAGTLNTSIRELRKTLGDDARKPTYIETVHRRGFRFIAPAHVGDTESLRVVDVPSHAVEHLVRATDAARRRSAPREAASYARRAVELLARLVGTSRADAKQRALGLELGRSVAALSVSSSSFERCLELCRELGQIGRESSAAPSELELLDAAHQQALELHYFARLSCSEIAQLDGSSTEAVASRVLAGLTRITTRGLI